ncbi:uncharacterized protein LOC144438487 [Glandiceps talaboti]
MEWQSSTRVCLWMFVFVTFVLRLGLVEAWCSNLPDGCTCDTSLTVYCRGSFTSPPGLPYQIHELILEGNVIEEIAAGELDGLSQLKLLDLSNNKIERIQNGAFAALQNLERLYLERNQINWLDKDVLKGLPRLRHLYLDHNKISFLPSGLFSGLPYLQELRLDGNELRDLPKHTADELSTTALRLITLDHNPLQCSCDLLLFSHWLREADDVLLLKQDSVKCTPDGETQTFRFTDLTHDDVTCAPAIKPKIVRVDTLTCDSVRIKWSYPANQVTVSTDTSQKSPPSSVEYLTSGQISPQFNILVKTTDSHESTPFPQITIVTDTTAIISGLRAFSEHQFMIQAMNKVGRGPFSDVIRHKISSYKMGEKIISCVTGEETNPSIDSPPIHFPVIGKHVSNDRKYGQSSTTIIIISSVAGAIVMVFSIVILLCKIYRPKRDILSPFKTVKFSKIYSKPPNKEGASPSTESVDSYMSYTKLNECAPTVRILNEVPRKTIVFVKDVHHGRFGRLYQADVIDLLPGQPIVRAMVKELKQNATERARKLFDGQVSSMCEFEHPNVLEILGVVTMGTPLSIIYEYAEFGDLKAFLNNYTSIHREIDAAQWQSLMLHHSKLVDMATQIACAMSYLATNGFVHRDLAARNCLLASDFSVKVSDLGIARELYPQDYIKVGRKLLPVRWMAPESLRKTTFTTESDVWSYGVTLWEIFSYGILPYCYIDNEGVAGCIKKGNCLPTPDDCPINVINIMTSCWQTNPHERASFQMIHSRLSNYRLSACGPMVD